MFVIAALLILIFTSGTTALIAVSTEAGNLAMNKIGDVEVDNATEVVVPVPIGSSQFDSFFSWGIGC